MLLIIKRRLWNHIFIWRSNRILYKNISKR